ncbi:MAG TPA: RHS repeat-associated core domain-containing protein [Victivallales bacterium]|nr:RHS repeat-associated core domain-containing protein [Victivallales bacterium]
MIGFTFKKPLFLKYGIIFSFVLVFIACSERRVSDKKDNKQTKLLQEKSNSIPHKTSYYKYLKDAVTLRTGKINLSYTDLSVSDGFFPLFLRRLYYPNSKEKPFNFGNGWNHNFDIRLNFPDNGTLVLKVSNSPEIIYTKTSKGIFKNTNNPNDIISKKTSDNSWIRTLNNFPIQRFSIKGYLINIFSQNGKSLKLNYGKDRRLSTIQTPNGHHAKFLYNRKGFISEITTDLGNSVKYFYYKNQLIKVIKPSGIFQYKYGNGNIETIIYPDYQASKFQYDSDNRIIEQYIGKNSKIKYKYLKSSDNSYLKTTITYPDGTNTVYEFDGNVIYITDALNGLEIYEYDDIGNILKYINPLGYSVKYQYDKFGRLVSLKGVSGENTKYIYKGNSKLPSSIIYPSGIKKTFTYNKFSNVILETDSLGNTFNYLYNDLGQLLKIKLNSESETRFLYNSKGYLIKKFTNDNYFELKYSNRGLITGLIDSTGDSISYNYNASELLKAETRGNDSIKYFYDNYGRLVKESDSLNRNTKYKYNEAGIISEIIYSSGESVKYDYDLYGNIVSTENSAQNKYKFKYDALNRVISETDPSGFSKAYTYDADGNRTSVTDEKGNITIFEYNSEGQLIKKTDPSLKTTVYIYSKTGLLNYIIYPDKSFVEFFYYKDGSLRQKNLSDGSSFTYKYNDQGNLISASGSHCQLTYRYDQLSNVITKQNSFLNKELNYKYDNSGKLSELILPEERSIKYTYNSDDNLSSITASNNKIFDFSYSIQGQSLISYPNGIKQSLIYDKKNGRLQKIFLKDSSGNIIREITYNYDDTGRIIQKKDNEFQDNIYKYDANGSLVYEKTHQGKTVNYKLDKCRNIISKTSGNLKTKYEYNNNNQLGLSDTTSFVYDSKGNLIKSFSTLNDKSFKYTTDGRISSISDNSHNAKIKYTYDPTGNRASEITKHKERFYLYDGINVVAEYDMSHNETCYYIYGSSSDNPLMAHTRNGNFYFHQDFLGNIFAVTDDKGNQVSIYSYEAYGKPIIKKEGFKSPYLFTGRRYDRNTGFYYYRMRYYNPEIARFLSRDPIFDTNLYLYCKSDPVNFNDPLGLRPTFQEVPLPSGVKSVTIDDYGAETAGLRLRPSFAGDNPAWDQKPPRSSTRRPSGPSFPVVNRRMNAADWEYTGQYGNVVHRDQAYVVDIWRNKNTGKQYARFVRGGTTGGLASALGHAWSNNQTPTIGSWPANIASRLSNVGRSAGRAVGRAGRGTFANINPTLVPLYNLSAAGLAAGGAWGAGVLIAGVGTAGYVGYEVGSILNEFEPVRRGATATMSTFMPPYQNEISRYGNRVSGLNPRIEYGGKPPAGVSIRAGTRASTAIRVIPPDRRLQIRSVLAKGCHAFMRKQFSQCSVLMDQVKDMIAEDLAKLKRDKSEINFYSDTLSTADDYYDRSLKAMDVVSIYNEAIEYFKNHQYDQCILKANEILNKDLHNLNLSELTLQSNALRNTALQNKEKRKLIEELYNRAFDQMNLLKLKEAFDTFSRIIDLNPAEVGLAGLHSRAESHQNTLTCIFVTERKVNNELPKAVSLFDQDKKEEAKQLFLKLKNMIEEQSHPAYFKNQTAVINKYLAMLKHTEINTEPLLSVSSLNVSPKSLLPGTEVSISGNVTLENFNALFRTSAAFSLTVENIGVEDQFLEDITNGNYPFSYTFKIPEDANPGVYRVIAHLTPLERTDRRSPLSIKSETADTFIVKSDDEEDASGLLNEISETEHEEESEHEEEVVIIDPEEEEQEIFGYLEPMFINNRELWEGDSLLVKLRYNIFGLQKDETVPVIIKVSSPGIGTKTYSGDFENGKYPAKFSWIIPANLSTGQKTVTAIMKFNKKFHSVAETYIHRKPKIVLLSTSAFPRRIKRPGSVKLAAQVAVSGLKPGTYLNVNGIFSGSNMSTYKETKKLSNESKVFYVTYKFTKNSKEGTYRYTFDATSDYGGNSLSGLFIVGRSDEEIREEQARIDRERREREEQQRREEENRRRARLQRESQQEYDNRSRSTSTNNRNNSSSANTADTSSRRKKSWCVYYYDRGRGSMKDVGYRELSSAKNWQRNIRSHQKIYIEETFYSKESAIRYLCSKLSQPQMHGYGYAAKYKGGVTLISKDIYKMIGGKVK